MGYEQNGGFLQSCISFESFIWLCKRDFNFVFSVRGLAEKLKNLRCITCIFPLACTFLPCLVPLPLFPTLFLPVPRILSPYAARIRGTRPISPAVTVKPYLQAAPTWWPTAKFLSVYVSTCWSIFQSFTLVQKVFFGIFGQNHPLDKSLTQNLDTIPKITHSPT